jgi:N-acetylglucosaminyl-diphospho-decaprenol L-rhamnosyltransferase
MDPVTGAVTAVVVTRDRAADLERTLPHHEAPVVVVDNGSSDATAEVARRHGALVFELGHNRGAAGRTVGVRAATTPYVAFADDDSWWAPGSLARAAAVLDAHPEVAVVAARVLVGQSGQLDAVCALMAASPLPPTAAGPAVLGFVACGAVVRRAAYLEVGGFSDHFGIGGEEELLALDLAAAGWQLAYVDALVVHHHPSVSRDPRRRAVVQHRNALWTAWLRRPVRVGVSTVLGSCRAKDRRAGLLQALRGLPWVLRQRRPLPPHVESLRALL